MHISEAEVSALEAVSQLFVIDAEQMQKRGVEVVDVGAVFLGVVTKRIGCAMGHSALDTAAGELKIKTLHVMITTHGALVTLGHRRAAEFAAPHD